MILRYSSGKTWNTGAAMAVAALAFIPAAVHAQAAPDRSATPDLPATPVQPVYLMELLQTGPLSETLQQKMIPLRTLDQVEKLLKQNSVAFSWRKTVVASESLNPALVQQFERLPPGEPFVVDRKERGALIGVITGRR